MYLAKGTFGQFPAHMCKGLHPYQQVILAWLWFHVNQLEGTCFPSLKLLSKETGISKSSVIRHLKELEKLGLIEKTRRTIEGKGDTSNVYKLLIVKRKITPVSEDNPPCPAETPTPVSEVDTNQTHTEPNPTNQTKNNTKTFNFILEEFNRITGASVRMTDRKKKQLSSRLGVFTVDEILQAVKNRVADPWVQEKGIESNWDALFRNDDKLDLWLSRTPKNQQTNSSYTLITDDQCVI